jgi:hypothetical protein
VKQKDIKLLWGRSGNRCALCKRELTMDANAVSSSFTLGEQAHIVGEEIAAARGASLLSPDERNSYHNLILLCPNDHTKIDKNASDWPVEKLYQAKSVHEPWVSETLSETVDHVRLANSTILSNLVDQAVALCALDDWKNWTSFALAPTPRWYSDRPEAIERFRHLVIAAVWPSGFAALRAALTTLSILAHRASETFSEHTREADDWIIARRYYKEFNNANFDEDARRFEEWIDRCHFYVRESMRAANWFADIVRRDINPMFFATKGKFLIKTGPMADLSFRTELIEFSEEEKARYPAAMSVAGHFEEVERDLAERSREHR